jgi:threonine dehydratase
LEDLPDVDVVLLPLGGGGLVVGVAMAIKVTHPHVKIYGVEAVGANSMYTSLQQGSIVAVDVNTICDGIAVPRVGSILTDLTKL